MKDHFGDELYFPPEPAPKVEAPRVEYPDGVPQDVADLFETLALEVRASGLTHFSSDAVLHQIRWHHNVLRKDANFKINDHYSSVLARWFLKRHPECEGFFELRKAKSDCIQ